MEKLSGETVSGKDIVVTAKELDFKGATISPIKDFKGTFDGQGVVLKNFVIGDKDNRNDEIALFSCLGGDSTFKNFVIENATYYAKAWCGGIACCISAKTKAENVYIAESVTIDASGDANGNAYAGGLFAACTTKNASEYDVQINNCVFAGTVKSNGKYNGGFIGDLYRATKVTITSSLVLGSVGTNTNSRGFIGNCSAAGEDTVCMSNCIYAGGEDNSAYTNYPFFAGATKAEITDCYTISAKEDGGEDDGIVYNSTKHNDPNSGVTLVKLSDLVGLNARDIAGFTKRDGDIMVPTGVSTFDIPTLGYSMVTWKNGDGAVLKEELLVNGTTPKYDGTTPTRESSDLFEYGEFKGWSPAISKVKGDVVYTATFESTPNTEEWAEVNGEYVISDVKQWLYFIEQVNGGNDLSGKTVKLAADITFNTGDATTWGYDLAGAEAIDPIGYDGAEHVFKGTFDGQNHVISGVYMNGLSTDIDMDGIGLFGFVSGATIKNFVLKNSYIKAQDWAGCIVGEAWVKSGDSATTIENVYVDKDVTMFSTQKTKDAGACVGGFVGGIYGGNVTVNISNCVFAGKVVATNSSVGGFVGNGYYKTVVLDNCLMLGSVVGGENSSGFVGYNTQAEDKSKIGTTTITNCIYAGTGYTSYPFGYFSPKTYEGETYFTIENCYTVTGSDKNVYKVRSWTEGEEDTMVAGTTTVKPTADGSGVTVIDGIHNYIGKSIISSWGTRAGDIPVPSGVKDFAPISFTQHLLDGASVRLDKPTGLRFKAVLGKAFLDSIKTANEGKEVTYGIIITPEDYITEAGNEFTVEALSKLNYETDYLEINADKLLDGGDDAGYYLFSGVIYDIDEGNYTREFSARAYVKVDDGNGNVTYYYSAYDSDVNSRSIADVAKAAYEDTNNSETDKYKYEIAENSGVYSPYEATKRALLPSFYEKVATDVYFMSYNIRNVEGGTLPFEYKDRQEAVVSYILSENPDVIGLQEVGAMRLTSWFDYLGDEDTQVGLTAKGYAVYVGENTSDDGKSDYNPIYYKTSRFELVENGAGSELLLDENGDPYTYYNSREQKLEEESRGYTYVTLRDKKTGEIFVYVNTHLIRKTTTEGYEDYQDDMARDFAEALKAKAFEYPVIIGGDFNGPYSVYKGYKAEGDEKAYWGETALSAKDEATNKTSQCSTTNGNFDTLGTSDGPIDLYFVVNAEDTVIHSYAVTDNKVTETGKYPSDHLPVKLVITIYCDINQ